MSNIIHRNAVRAILLTPGDEVLLMRIRMRGRDPFWITPGGGIEARESETDALVRELKEEVGIAGTKIGARLFKRDLTFQAGGSLYIQKEAYFAVHVPRFAPVMSDAQEATVLDGFRWWKLADLRETRERIAPASLAPRIQAYLRDGPPDVLEVVTD
jgi:8-oxo-dGTP pyrophosphatase MutT (NUDIX family)